MNETRIYLYRKFAKGLAFAVVSLLSGWLIGYTTPSGVDYTLTVVGLWIARIGMIIAVSAGFIGAFYWLYRTLGEVFLHTEITFDYLIHRDQFQIFLDAQRAQEEKDVQDSEKVD